METRLPSLTIYTRRSRQVALALGLYAFAGGALSFLGWALDVPRLTNWDGNGISIQPNATIAATAAGAGILALAFGRRRVGLACGLLVASIGGSAVFQYLTGTNLGIDHVFLFNRPWGGVGVIVPGRMGPPGATSWFLVGCALSLTSSAGASWRRTAVALSFAALSIATLSIIGYLYGASTLYSIPTVTVIAFQTATFIFAVAVGILLNHPAYGVMRLFNDAGPAGLLVRRAAPVLVLFPIVLGLLTLTAVRMGVYDSAFGTAVRTVLEMAAFLVLLWWTARAIGRQADSLAQSHASVRASEGLARERATLLQTVLNTSPVPIWMALDRNCERIVGNPAGDALLRTLPSPDVSPVSTAADPPLYRCLRDGAEVPADQLPMQRAAREGVPIQSQEFEVVRADGSRCWILMHASPLIQDGVPWGAVAVAVDITDRKLSEKRMAADLHAMTIVQQVGALFANPLGDRQLCLDRFLDAAILVTDADKGYLQIVDPATNTLTVAAVRGFDEQFLAFFSGDRVKDLAAAGQALKAAERIVIPDIRESVFFPGQPSLNVFVSAGVLAQQCTPLLSSDGRILGVVSTHYEHPHHPSPDGLRTMDVLARHAADYLQRATSEQALLEADRRKDEFLATLAHELRNPLSPIQNAIHLLQAPGVDPDLQRRATSIMERQVRHVVRLVDDLLEVSRISRGKIDLRREVIDVARIVSNAVDVVGPVITAAQQQLVVNLPPHPIHLHVDPVRLTQVLGNLLGNASKYTDEGGTITIDASVVDETASITVRDTGVGIPREMLPRVFDMFTQVDRTLGRAQGGLGIGLALVKHLVMMHGGRIEAHSDGPGRGAEFVVRLPKAAGTGEGLVTAEQPAGFAAVPGTPRCLVVDDNRDAADTLAWLLRTMGAEVQVSYDGSAALTCLRLWRPSVIFLDLGMPGLDGYAVAALIRAEPEFRNVTIVAVTGWGQRADRERTREAGFDAHLTKPVAPGALTAIFSARQGSASVPGEVRVSG